MGIILKQDRLIHTFQRHESMLGSSQWLYDRKTNVLRRKTSDLAKKQEKAVKLELSDDSNFKTDLSDFEKSQFAELKRITEAQFNEIVLESSLKRPKKEVYKLNKNKVKEKCNALFGLKQSVKFLAFITISYPVGFSDNDCMQVFNTFLTRCRKKQRLSTYLWVAERQSNGTLHFHVLTNNFLQIRVINRYMSVAIDNHITKQNLKLDNIEYEDNKGNLKLSKAFDKAKYNGVDVKRCEGNRKRLNLYLTKYVSKNTIEFFRLPYHSSRDISQLFTAQSFWGSDDFLYQSIKDALKHVETLVLDNDYCTVEFLNVKQKSGKYFSPPPDWFSNIDFLNSQIYLNYHSTNVVWDKLPCDLSIISKKKKHVEISKIN